MGEQLRITAKGETVTIGDDEQGIGRRKFLGATLAAGSLAAWAATASGQASGGGDEPVPAIEPRVPEGKVLKVGLIGCGSVSGSYLPHLCSQPFIKVVSVCDIIPKRAEKRAAENEIDAHFPHIDAMLHGPHFDLLVNTTSMPSHEPVSRKALMGKRNVWSEKPMALEVAKAKELMQLAKDNGVRIWGAPNTILSPQFHAMCRAVKDGKLGRVTNAHGTYGHNGPTWSAWFYEKGGGSLYDLGVYNVTTMTGLLGPVKEVVGMTAILNDTRKVDDKGTVKVTADENTMLIMNHGNGVLSHVQTGFGYWDGAQVAKGQHPLYTLEVVGTEGALFLQGWDWGTPGLDVATKKEPGVQTVARKSGPYTWQGGASYIAKCMLTGTEPILTAEHSLHVLDVMNACHESQATGKRVAVESTFKWPIGV
jgi:predicted dehydrogenase